MATDSARNARFRSLYMPGKKEQKQTKMTDKREKIGFIGGGNMATAIIKGILHTQLLPAADVWVFDISEERRKALGEMGCRVASSSVEIVDSCKYLLLAVKPQVIEGVLEEIAPRVTDNTVILSIAAGISCKYIRQKIGFDCKVVNVMPNTPLLMGSGTSALSRNEPIEEEEFQFALKIFQSAGQAYVIPSQLMNEVIPLNSSSPAFIYYFAKIYVERAEKAGFSRELANELFCNTLIGSAKMMLESGLDHDTLLKMVTSPGGTTLKGLEAMDANGFRNAVEQGIDACIQRAYELGK